MDSTIAAVLMLDGIGNGAVYALLGMAIVLVFAVTRVILIPQGEFVAYSALTLAMLQLGRVPGTVWLALLLAALTVLRELWDGLCTGRAWALTGVEIARLCTLPVAAATLTWAASGHAWPLAAHVSVAAATGRVHRRAISTPVRAQARPVHRPSHSSRSTVSAASSSASHTVPGTRPSCSIASVSAL